MAFIDELKVSAKAGGGGNGVVRWLHQKGKEFGGPSGGNGGRGGDVYVHAVRDVALLARYTGTKQFNGERGEDGGNRNMHGKDGKDMTIDLPIGSVLTNLDTGEVFDLAEEDQQIMILKGGRGGLGNNYFKSSINRSPEDVTTGQQGQEADFTIELRLVADAGLIGLPNAGKSSLLNMLTNAAAKVGSYAFTTLDPNLGALFGFVLADIPGLIEGASSGKGLGHKFLRHILRTKMLLHCVSLESENILEDYNAVRTELASFSRDLATKKELVILTKADSVSPEQVTKALQLFKKEGKDVVAVSILDDSSIKVFQDTLLKHLQA